MSIASFHRQVNDRSSHAFLDSLRVLQDPEKLRNTWEANSRSRFFVWIVWPA